MKPKEVYELGLNRGYTIGQYVEVPEVGDVVETEHGEFVAEDIEEAFMALAFDSENMNRSYTPFEFTAHDLNELEHKLSEIQNNKVMDMELKDWFLEEYACDDVWYIFDNAIYDGFKKAWEEECRS